MRNNNEYILNINYLEMIKEFIAYSGRNKLYFHRDIIKGLIQKIF